MKKILSLVVTMLAGINAWAAAGDVKVNANIDFSNPITNGVVAGSVNSMTIGTGSGAAARIEDGCLRQGDVTNVVTIPAAERAGSRDIVNISLKMAWGNKNGMGSSFTIKDAEGGVIATLSHCRWGSSTNTLNIASVWDYSGSQYQNKPIVDRYTQFDIEINYATSVITTKVMCQPF